MKHFVLLTLFTALFFTWVSCEKENVLPKEATIQNEDPVIAALLERGYKPEDIRVTDKHYVIQGDMLIPLDYAINSSQLKQASLHPDYLLRRECGSLKTTFNVYLDENTFTLIEGEIDAVVNTSISRINSVNSYIRLNRTSSRSNSDIRIENFDFDEDSDPDNNNTLGSAYLPLSTTHPGYLVKLDENDMRYYSSSQLFGVIAHELLHTIGMHHTDFATAHEPEDWQGRLDEYQIPWTPTSDAGSIMNHNVGGISFSSIPHWDAEALRKIYPNHTVEVSGPVKASNSGTYTWFAWSHYGCEPFTYRWYYSRDGGQTYTTQIGTGSTLNVPMPLNQDLYLLVKATSSNGYVTEKRWFVMNTSIKP